MFRRSAGDFSTHSSWIEHHPAITLEGGDGSTIGVRRRVTYADGTFFNEVLTGMDDRCWTQEYDVVGVLPLPVYNVVGAMQQLFLVTLSGGTLVERRLSYDTPLPQDEAIAFEKTRYVLLADSLDLLARLFAYNIRGKAEGDSRWTGRINIIARNWNG